MEGEWTWTEGEWNVNEPNAIIKCSNVDCITNINIRQIKLQIRINPSRAKAVDLPFIDEPRTLWQWRTYLFTVKRYVLHCQKVRPSPPRGTSETDCRHGLPHRQIYSMPQLLPLASWLWCGEARSLVILIPKATLTTNWIMRASRGSEINDTV